MLTHADIQRASKLQKKLDSRRGLIVRVAHLKRPSRGVPLDPGAVADIFIGDLGSDGKRLDAVLNDRNKSPKKRK